jgi:hypothetical protein
MDWGHRWGATAGDVSSRPRRGSAATLSLGVCLAVIAFATALPSSSAAFPTLSHPAPQTVKKAMWGTTSFNGVPTFPIYRDLGVGLYEIQLRWDLSAPTRPSQPSDPNDPAYQWPPELRAALSEAESQGMQTSLMLLGAPSWSNGGKEWKWAPTNPQDFGDFAAAAARKYPDVHLWMIWGEPNRGPNFAPFHPAPPKGPLNNAQAEAPRTYAQMLDSAYGALKAASPTNLVIGGNTFTAAGPGSIHTYQWIRYMRLPGGARPRMDMYGHNPYGFRIPNLHDPPSARGQVDFSDLRRLGHALNKAFPGPPLKLFLSEWGVPTSKRDFELGYSISRKAQVRWIRAAFKIVRKWKRIYTLGWIHPFDTVNPSGTQGLLDINGDPKPGYFAFKSG